MERTVPVEGVAVKVARPPQGGRLTVRVREEKPLTLPEAAYAARVNVYVAPSRRRLGGMIRFDVPLSAMVVPAALAVVRAAEALTEQQ